MKKVLKIVWNMLRSNLMLKIMAVLFAVILWSYVIAETNPMRERVLTDIPVRYQYTEELQAKNLAISGSLSDILDAAEVRLELNQSNLKYLSDESVNVFIDLSTINGPGEHTLKITATTQFGQVLEVSPSTVTLYVDDYVTRSIPVNVYATGTVPEGYYADMPEISPEVVTIAGARMDVEKVASAACFVDLDGLKVGYNKSVEVELLDSEGNPVDKRLFADTLPSVIVDLNVLTKKTVPVNVEGAILGQDELAAGYEIAGITCTPENIEIAGEADTLRAVSSMGLVPYSVSGASTSVSVLLDFQPPDGVTVLTGGKAQVYVQIREITETKEYSAVNIETRNLANGLTVQISQSSTDVTVIAGTARLSALDRSQIVPYVDLEGLAAGEYSLDLLFETPEGFSKDSFSADVPTVTVTIF